MKSCFFIFAILLIMAFSTNAQNYNSPDSLITKIKAIGAMTDETARKQETDSLWNWLKAHDQIPCTLEDTAVFLYRGEASQVTWAGDMTGWQVKNETYGGKNPGESTIWYLRKVFPADARLDYKIVRNSNEWLLDPDNPHQQLSGFGWNSELRMPEWTPSPYTSAGDDVQKGTLSDNVQIESDALNYTLQYRVYLPHGYSDAQNYPVVYVADGQEYAHPDMGGMIQVLDNLIHQELIEPVIAVFMDPRQPDNLSNNRRAGQYTCNPDFVKFAANELVPAIDAQYATLKDPQKRCILGTSYGGNNAGYFGAMRPDVFGLIAPQSPAFFDETLNLYKNKAKMPLSIFMTTGVIHDTQYQARQMKGILTEKNYDFGYIEVNEGHSWGNWCALVDDILLFFFETGNASGMEIPSGKRNFQVFPTRLSPGEALRVKKNTQSCQLAVYNLQGKLIRRQILPKSASVAWQVPLDLNPGIFLLQLRNQSHFETFKLFIH